VPNPFEGRSFPSPNLPDKREKVEGEHPMEARVVVRVPNTTLDQAIKDDLAIKIYKIKPGPTVVHTLTPTTMSFLQSAGRLDLQHDIPANKLAPELKRLGRKLPRR
jgi:hypothetical protein